MSGAEFIRYLERSSGVRLPQIRRLHNSLLSGGESPAAAAIEGGAKSRKTILRQRSEARRRQHRRKINQLLAMRQLARIRRRHSAKRKFNRAIQNRVKKRKRRSSVYVNLKGGGEEKDDKTQLEVAVEKLGKALEAVQESEIRVVGNATKVWDWLELLPAKVEKLKKANTLPRKKRALHFLKLPLDQIRKITNELDMKNHENVKNDVEAAIKSVETVIKNMEEEISVEKALAQQ